MWNSRNKTDLIIEVWEKLDCESVGAAEIEAIEIVVLEEFGPQAVDSPMVIARMLADEGAQLRHSEIMTLYLVRRAEVPYASELRNLFDLTDLRTTLRSIRNAESLRKVFASEGDLEGLRRLRELAIKMKGEPVRLTMIRKEANEWLTIWLQSPDLFDNWIRLRVSSAEFRAAFGEMDL